MAGEIPDLVALERSGTGKGAARQARRDGMVPGILFGGDAEPLAIQMPFNKMLHQLKAEGHDDVRVICRDVQRDVVKDLPTHFDLMRLRRTTRINLFIHVDFINEEKAPGLKRGGVLTIVRQEVELNVLAGDIPDHITVDLEGKQIGDVIHISDVTLPEGVKPTVDRDFVIANISAPRGLRADDAAEGEAEGDEE
ncbi:50S ribosomal protein L25/general stress protein Ctc [Salipiger sp. HF18]|uniref:50S ribosomal protein L25/general stress protein Ctc n=1 Tax=Salipiger sp. HF18 TaxID=2721557 RepID=UPI00142E5E80|nr:50S ribosomal protein L25/general stress protein Ctc [Salipiger sp. HF18]NIY98106.1 50S ribosomal protein L25/general stress protein Ctc [Salipiger sp. HF18]